MFDNIYKNKKVFVTGHTGFKGSWLVFWLTKLGANIVGYSDKVPTNPSHFELLNLHIKSIFGDIRDLEKLNLAIKEVKPDIVFHLAAQPLVRYSYKNTIETYETNVIGTLKVFEACRQNGVKAIVNITSDKCYENKEWVWGYRENDPMGGYDPYSSSKGCAEILTASYRNSYFNIDEYGKTHETLLASARAGNVIGGGDWAEDRLICDVVRATIKNETVLIRNPNATRPWQHVLEPLSGYLLLGQKLLEGKEEFAEGWNFGPSEEGNYSVGEVLDCLQRHWDKVKFKVEKNAQNLHEANLLKLDCSKANIKLGWKPTWDSKTTFEKTIKWYREFYEGGKILSEDNLNEYIQI
ncbi:CDP-glucose 4,6-dehydratase [Campylobacter californiensis]|uniref:CDP-glucose 4,6-dehydratase n=1 Tax=Campylobacter californiensis TaxID=1032243 RepID=UPI001473A625|nr:CDP-glucose 4,6-dehydratase [Campylobacter sp. RM12916]MBE3609020.1 CDP-glucose 4,6-dehydratase [Campylobacter sp. RM12916]